MFMLGELAWPCFDLAFHRHLKHQTLYVEKRSTSFDSTSLWIIIALTQLIPKGLSGLKGPSSQSRHSRQGCGLGMTLGSTPASSKVRNRKRRGRLWRAQAAEQPSKRSLTVHGFGSGVAGASSHRRRLSLHSSPITMWFARIPRRVELKRFG